MKIETINTLEGFKKIRRNWESVYQLDPQSLFFVSWIWLASRLELHHKNSEPWLILAAKVADSDTSYVAFFPLFIDLDEKEPGKLYTEFSILGVADANHVPFICFPNYEKAVALAFARHLQHSEVWSVLKMSNILETDTRLGLFLDCFPQESYCVQELQHINDVDSVDNNIVPYIVLPDDWDSYLQTSLSSNTRQKIRRLLRKVEQNDEFQVTQATPETLEGHINILLDFWQKSWMGRKGDQQCCNILTNADLNLRHCFANDCLYLPILWRDNQPLGAIANLIDRSKKSILFFMGGRDETVKNLSTGIILHALGIRFAIQNGFEIYDFLMGNEAYKFSLGARSRRTKIVALQRRGQAEAFYQLNRATLPQALQVASIYHQANRLAEAEHSYRQILQIQPNHGDALYGLGVVCQRMGHYRFAETYFRQLLELQPDHGKAWFSLGTLYQMQDRLLDAEQAFRQALTVPSKMLVTGAVYHNLGYLLQQRGDWDGAIDCYQQAKMLQPDCTETDVILANALYHQGQLSAEKQGHYATLNKELGDQRRRVDDLKVAIAYYQQAIAMQPDLADAYYYLGLTLKTQGETPEDIVKACYQRAWQLQPSYREAEVAMANIQYHQGQLPSSEHSPYAIANYELGNQYQKNHELDVAITYYRQAILMQPDLAAAHYHLGQVLHLKGQPHWHEAISCYQSAQKQHPNYPEADLGIAAILYQQGKLEQDAQLQYAAMSYQLGDSQKQLGDLQTAIESYQLAIAMNPALAEAKNALRMALQERDGVTIKTSCTRQ